LPTLAELETLSKIYACPFGYFFLDSPPDERLPFWHRKQGKVDIGDA
jgi:hypothetical protein